MFHKQKINFGDLYLKIEAAEKLQEAGDIDRAIDILENLADEIQKEIKQEKKK